MSNHEIFFMVYRENGSPPTFRHATQTAAEKEAERLARAYPGNKFHVLACISSVKITDLDWTRANIVPF